MSNIKRTSTTPEKTTRGKTKREEKPRSIPLTRAPVQSHDATAPQTPRRVSLSQEVSKKGLWRGPMETFGHNEAYGEHES